MRPALRLRADLGDTEKIFANEFKRFAKIICGIGVSPTQHIFQRPYIALMTRARKAAEGLATPPPLDRWIEAMLLLCVSLVQGVAATLGMTLNRNHRDWHTTDADEALPQAKSDIQLNKETTSTHGVIPGLVPRTSVGASKGLANDALEKNSQNSRHKAENDFVVVARIRATLSCHSGRRRTAPQTRKPGITRPGAATRSS